MKWQELESRGKMHKFDPKNLDKLDNPKRRESMPPLEILKKFGIGEAGTLLDIGSGTGYFTLAAAEILKNGNAIGLDIMDEMIQVATSRSLGMNNIEYRKSEEYSFPVEDKSVEYVFISNVLHEIEDKVKYLNEIIRVLKPKGALCVIEWDKSPMEMGPPIEERISIEELKKLGSSVGLEFEEKIEINSGHYGIKFRN